jgi:hypothetical protein
VLLIIQNVEKVDSDTQESNIITIDLDRSVDDIATALLVWSSNKKRMKELCEELNNSEIAAYTLSEQERLKTMKPVIRDLILSNKVTTP